MHEFAVTKSILAIVLEKAREVKAGKITKIDLLVGRLTGYIPEQIQLQFDILCRNTEAAGASLIFHHDQGLFAGLPSPFAAGRYHSLIARRDEIPDAFEVTAWTAEGEVMGVRHTELALEGVQFHPESILTPEGPRLLAAFLKRTH
jgi:hypothetical protein